MRFLQHSLGQCSRYLKELRREQVALLDTQPDIRKPLRVLNNTLSELHKHARLYNFEANTEPLHDNEVNPDVLPE